MKRKWTIVKTKNKKKQNKRTFTKLERSSCDNDVANNNDNDNEGVYDCNDFKILYIKDQNSQIFLKKKEHMNTFEQLVSNGVVIF